MSEQAFTPENFSNPNSEQDAIEALRVADEGVDQLMGPPNEEGRARDLARAARIAERDPVVQAVIRDNEAAVRNRSGVFQPVPIGSVSSDVHAQDF